MGNKKAYNSFTDAYKGTGVNCAPQPDQKLPDMSCPAIPNHHNNLNFWQSSCNIKQQMPEHETTCYPYCKRRREGLAGSHPHTKEDIIYRHPLSSEYAIAVGKEIIDLYQQGLSRPEIAEKVGRGIETVSKRLREAGFVDQRRIGSFRQKILAYLEKSPDASWQYIQKIFGCARSTAEGYKSDFKKGKRAIKE